MNVTQYLALVPSRHQDKPRYMAWLRAVLSLWVDLANCALAMDKAFSVDQAQGPQLDWVGKMVGVSRQLPFTPSEGGRTLGDDDYRRLIKAAIAQNAWDGTNESLPKLLNDSFPELGITIGDNMDMTMKAVVRGSFTQLQIEMLNADLLIPRPAGVGMTYEVPGVASETTVQAEHYNASAGSATVKED